MRLTEISYNELIMGDYAIALIFYDVNEEFRLVEILRGSHDNLVKRIRSFIDEDFNVNIQKICLGNLQRDLYCTLMIKDKSFLPKLIELLKLNCHPYKIGYENIRVIYPGTMADNMYESNGRINLICSLNTNMRVDDSISIERYEYKQLTNFALDLDTTLSILKAVENLTLEQAIHSVNCIEEFLLKRG